jgi:uncharacterized membrane protein YbhN (UPF0104 family)
MRAPGKIQLALYLFLFAGAALFTALLIHQGVSQVVAAFAAAGWAVAGVIVYHFVVPVFLDALAWWVLFPKADRLPLPKLLWMRWIGESVSTLVPSAAVGGDVVRARLAAIDGAPLSISAASVIVDITLGVFTQAVFTILGLVLLVNVTGHRSFVGPTLLGTLIGIVAVAGFYFVQRLGMFRFLGLIIARLARSPEWQSLVQSGETLDQSIRKLYARPRGVMGCCAWTIISLIAGSGRNLDCTTRAFFASDIRQRAHPAKHGFNNSLCRVSRPRRLGRAGRRLSCCGKSSRYSRRCCFCPFLDCKGARTGAWHSRAHYLAGDRGTPSLASALGGGQLIKLEPAYRVAQGGEPPFYFCRAGKISAHAPPDPGQTAGKNELLPQLVDHLGIAVRIEKAKRERKPLPATNYPGHV